MSHPGVNSSIIQSLCCLTLTISQCVPVAGVYPLGYFSQTPLACSYNASRVEPQHSTATLPPGCLLFMLPKCLKTDGEGNTQTVEHSDSVSSLKAYIIYRSLYMVRESQSGSVDLSDWKQTFLMWIIFILTPEIHLTSVSYWTVTCIILIKAFVGL